MPPADICILSLPPPYALIARNAAGATVVAIAGLTQDQCERLAVAVLPKPGSAAAMAPIVALMGVATAECWK
jgi:hypothetical protein